jgi:hypothetical protein
MLPPAQRAYVIRVQNRVARAAASTAVPTPGLDPQDVDLLSWWSQDRHMVGVPPAGQNPYNVDIPRQGEIGTTGLKALIGKVNDDYNAEMGSLLSRMRVFEEMRRACPAVAVAENLVRLPIEACEFSVDPRDDKELGAAIEDNLMEGMNHSFRSLVREMLLAVLYGFSVHEMVFESKPGGFFGWRKFAPRDRRTIWQWQFDSGGEIRGVVQYGINPGPSTWQYEAIPEPNLFLSTWRRENGNPEGLGAMRQMYFPYDMWYKLCLFAMMRVEREAVPIPVATAPKYSDRSPDLMKKDTDIALDFVKNIRAGQNRGVVLPAEWEIKTLEIGKADVPFMQFIEMQHQMILQTMLAQFVGYSQGGQGGSFGLSQDSSSLFLMSLEATADWVCETINRHAIPWICRANGFTGKKPPRLIHGTVGTRDVRKWAQSNRQMVGPNGMMFPEMLEAWFEMNGVPEPDWLETYREQFKMGLVMPAINIRDTIDDPLLAQGLEDHAGPDAVETFKQRLKGKLPGGDAGAGGGTQPQASVTQTGGVPEGVGGGGGGGSDGRHNSS